MINLPIIERAHEAFKLSMFDDALKWYGMELVDDPQNVSIIINIGFINYYKFDLLSARACFARAIQLNGDSQIAWFGMYIVARRMRDRAAELEALYKVHQIGELPFDLLMENVNTFYEN